MVYKKYSILCKYIFSWHQYFKLFKMYFWKKKQNGNWNDPWLWERYEVFSFNVKKEYNPLLINSETRQFNCAFMFGPKYIRPSSGLRTTKYSSQQFSSVVVHEKLSSCLEKHHKPWLRERYEVFSFNVKKEDNPLLINSETRQFNCAYTPSSGSISPLGPRGGANVSWMSPSLLC